MADSVDIKYLFNGNRKAVVKITNDSDGTGESGVVKVDISTLVGPNGLAPTRTSIEKIEGNVQGFTAVKLYWDHTTDDELAFLGPGFIYEEWGDIGHADPGSAGGTGDIILTTVGAVANATYDLTITFRLKD